jgi:phosphonate transport system substrate-binding protein
MNRLRLPTLFILVLLLTLLIGCTPPATPAPTAAPTEAPTAEGRAFVLGDIADDPAEVIAGMQPLADYLAAQLKDQGITEGQVKVAASAEEMEQLLKDGEVDLYFDSVYPAMLISDASGAQPLLRRWRRGVGEYHTVIFTSKESGITSVDELKGHLIALDNEFSTSGFVLPAAYLTEQGLTLVGKESYDESAAADEVGFVFSHADENTLQWVLSGNVAAGATDNNHFEDYPKEAADQLVVLAETESVPRQVVLVRPGMDQSLLEAVNKALLEADESEDGKAALQNFDKTSQFDEFPQGIDAALKRMRELQEIVAGIKMP